MPTRQTELLRSLSCIGRSRYDSIDSLNSYNNETETEDLGKSSNENSGFSTKSIRLTSSFPFIRRDDDYSAKYNRKTEKARLLPSWDKKVKYRSLIDQDLVQDVNFKKRKAVRFDDDNNQEFQESTNSKRNKSEKNKKKKKKSLLKRTGMFIVKSCRLMTYGAPYLPPGFAYNNNRFPSDYCNYDFETGEYNYNNSNHNYMFYSSAAYF